jgi:hypothetical protein
MGKNSHKMLSQGQVWHLYKCPVKSLYYKDHTLKTIYQATEI